MTSTRVPFVDLQAQYAQVRDEVEASVAAIMASGDYVSGKETRAFEGEFARFCRVKHAIGVGNGTDALRIALEAVGAGPGTEVVTVAHSFVATAEAIVHTGATPRFVDVEATTGNMDASLLADAINERTCAVVVVHLYGRPADIDAINSVARVRGIPVIEDAAQAHGAQYKGRLVGSLGDLACFSFYPSKNLGAAGDGGAITTNSDELAGRMRWLANHGSTTKYVHEIVGHNSRLDSIQAAVLRAKLRHLDGWNGRRRALASEYYRLLRDIEGLRLPAPDDETFKGVHHLFAVRVADRDGLASDLLDRGIATGVHYPIGIHRQRAFAGVQEFVPSLPNTENWADNELSLPMFETMTVEQVAEVAQAVAELAPAHSLSQA